MDEVRLRIINLLGEEILELKEAPGSERLIDLSDHPSGIYFIKVDDCREVMKIVKR